jgi:hypothetical protein
MRSLGNRSWKALQLVFRPVVRRSTARISRHLLMAPAGFLLKDLRNGFDYWTRSVVGTCATTQFGKSSGLSAISRTLIGNKVGMEPQEIKLDLDNANIIKKHT